MRTFVNLVFCVALCYGQSFNLPVQDPFKNDIELQHELSEKIGNFSIEVLFHTSKTLQNGQNFIMSPITVWSVLAAIAEGASGRTKSEVNNVLRLSPRDRDTTRSGFKNIIHWLQVNTNAVELVKINTIFVDKNRLPLPDYTEIVKDNYQTEVVTLDFSDTIRSANYINQAISDVTRGKIPNLVDPSYFQNSQMMLTSALYFKGQWAMPFNKSYTMQMPFYDTNGKEKIGDVNMMSNKHNYPFINKRELQAKIVEMPYGKENRLSMLIMLPNPRVSVEDMFLNFNKVNLDTIFEELRVSKGEYGDNEVECFIPRFKIKSDIDLTNVLKERMGVQELFDRSRAQLPFISKTPLFVSRIVQKAEIEVTEEGTEAAAVTVAEFTDRIAVQFIANRPFAYMIIEKITNSILFGGFYKTPSLY